MATLNEKSHAIQITIAQVSKLESVYTSKVVVHGIPWKVKIFKVGTAKADTDSDDSDDSDDEDDNSWLAARLICANKDDSLRWSIAGAVSFKLLPFIYGANALEVNCTPSVFNCMSLKGFNSIRLIRWNDLFDKNSKYVKDDDTIDLQINIKAENPNDPSRSRIELKCYEEGCDCGSSATFRLIVKNISNLMAVRAPRFDLRGLSWNIVVGRDASREVLFAQLYFDELTKEISCPVTWTIKLLSSKADINPIEETLTESVFKSTDFLAMDILAWNELFKPENGYVRNDSITLEVNIETYKPRGVGSKNLPIAKRAKFSPENSAEFLKLECPICMKSISDQELAVTPCGHMFCSACIKNAVTKRTACPLCNKAVQSNALLPFFLPM